MKQFDGQHEDEEVIFIFRRHIIAMRKGFYLLLIPFLVMSLPTLISPLFPYSLSAPNWWSDPLNLLILSIIGLVVGLILFFYQWIGWYFSVFIVTNQRLRQVSQTGLFSKSVIDLGLSKIQNISYNVEGFNAAIFGFGTIVVQTYVGDLVLDRIHQPGKIYNKLQDAVSKVSKDSDIGSDEKV